MTADEVAQQTADLAVRYEEHWKDDQKVRHFAQRLEQVADSDVFDGLFRYFRESGYGDPGTFRQEIAGTLLFLRAPKPTISLEEIMRESVEYYNLSIEQLPWYLSLHFGRDSFRAAVESALEDRSLSEKVIQSLKTFLYWVSIPEEEIREELRPFNERDY